MSKIAIKTDLLKKALDQYGKDTEVQLSDTKNTSIQLNEENKDLLAFLNEQIPLSLVQKQKIAGFLFKGVDLAVIKVDSVNDFFNKLSFINESSEPVFEVKINAKWYPLMAYIEKWQSMNEAWICRVVVRGNLGAMQYEKSVMLGSWSFEDKAGVRSKKSIDQVLSEASFGNIRIASKESIEHAKTRSKKVLELWGRAGKVYDSFGSGINYGFFGWYELGVGSKNAPTTVIIEPTLENREARNGMEYDESWQLPFIRVFSLALKTYVFVAIDEITEHEYVTDSKDKIVLPQRMLTALDSIFNADASNIFGDLFRGRHGGIVVLANGPSGVGKTLTAEVYAEQQKRPLYSMEMNEVGTTVKEVEANLQRIFARAKKWNAVLLFDEADIFLSERTVSDLERSAIVGIFLRLLDYYEGTFFLTTNRGGEIDKAFKSRVTLYLNYPELDSVTRHTIWKNMLSSANLNVVADMDTWDKIVSHKLNGRQIRNQVRLLRLMHPGGNITGEDILASFEFAAI